MGTEAKPGNKFKIVLPVFVTDEGVFSSFAVNRLRLTIRDPQNVMGALFGKVLPKLRSEGIHAYPHEGYLYFILSERNPEGLSTIGKTLKGLAEEHRDSVSYEEPSRHTVEIASLYPVTNASHFVIIRSLLYSMLKKGIASKYKKYERHGKEGLTVYVDRLYSGVVQTEEGSEEKVIINRYIRLYFELTPAGRGRIWIDMVTRAISYIVGIKAGPRRLSHHDMRRLDANFYKKYREKAMLEPKERLRNEVYYVVNRLKLDDTLQNLCYYLLNPDSNSFAQYCIKFHMLHDVSQILTSSTTQDA